MASLHGAERVAYGESMLQLTLQPYKYILAVLVVMLLILAVTKMPSAKPIVTGTQMAKVSFRQSIAYLRQNNRFKKGVLAQFIYVGMQTAVWSFTIRRR